MSKKYLLISFLCLLFYFGVVMSGYAQSDFVANYDESKVPEYTLPDPLRAEDGSQIETAEQWQNKRRGEVLALTGENGAGKSTLSKIIGGLEMPTLGHMHFNGQAYAPGSRSHAEKLGVRMVMQELNLLPTLTVAENLFLDNLPGRLGWISRKQLRAQLREQLENTTQEQS